MRCRKGVRKKESVSRFCNKSIVNSKRLRDEILSGKYKISPYVKFQIHEPKTRDIMATRIRDRVWQNSMVKCGVYQDMTRSNIYDNGACQIEKGTSFAVYRTIELMRRYYRKHGNSGWAVHLDAKKYFPSTPHEVSKQVIKSHIREEKFIPFLCDIIDSFDDPRKEEEIQKDPFGARGTGLGSPVSQLVQLAIPGKIDHAMKEKFGIKYYVRYNDDVLMWDPDKEKLLKAVDYAVLQASCLGITVVKKDDVYPIKRGMNFLQKRFILTDTGKVVVRISHKAITAERRALRGLKARLDKGEKTMADVEAHYQSWVSGPHRLHCDGIIRSMDNYYKEIFRRKPVYKFN